jgi:3-methyladenine DNA glycosylase AlkD
VKSDIRPQVDFDKLLQLAKENSIEEKAPQMKAYMKNKFDFIGLPSPQRKLVVSEYLKSKNIYLDDSLFSLIELLWDARFREMQYIALDILDRVYKKMDESHLHFLIQLITTKSWWDTVDGLAANGVGSVLFENEVLSKRVAKEWIESEDIWLKRTAIIFQLKYKSKVDEGLLFSLIIKEIDNREFFVQKACGWALRQYSKFNPNSVANFIDQNPNLSRLCIREASKYL